ncbi:MAG: chorismate synthase [Candidatus Latescibacterota bacterium]|jgi:chorismate synthase
MEILGGPLFGVAGAGESHGPAISTIVFGCPPGLWVERASVQHYLDRRRPGGNKLGTPRREDDKVVFLSGLYGEDHERLLSGPQLRLRTDGVELETQAYEAGYTTGEPISAIVLSAAKRSADYQQFAGTQGEVRPGHTDLVKHYQSAGYVDVRGGGRSSYRSTISDVIGGSFARLFLQEHFDTAVFSSICQVGELRAQKRLADRVEELCDAKGQMSREQVEALEDELSGREIYSLDADFAAEAAALITRTRKAKDSLGSAVEIVAVNVPSLLGDPLYQSLKMRLMGSLGGLHAVQACEVGAGSDVAERLGSDNNDSIRRDGYTSNSHGGLIGGITTGKPLVCRVSFKPTSTIALAQESVRKDLQEIDFELRKGRHDPCLGVRAGVTLESRLAIELMNALLMRQAGCVDEKNFKLF